MRLGGSLALGCPVGTGGVPQLHRNGRLIAAVHNHCDKGSWESQATNLETMGNLRNLILLAAILVRPD